VLSAKAQKRHPLPNDPQNRVHGGAVRGESLDPWCGLEGVEAVELEPAQLVDAHCGPFGQGLVALYAVPQW
jgi:hypothetical protein